MLLILLVLVCVNVSFAKTVVIELPSAIEEHSTRYAQEALLQAQQGDIVLLRVIGTGGSIMEGIRLLHAMKASPAEIWVHVIGPAYSMHAILVCHADKAAMEPHSYLMFHEYSATFHGKASDTRTHLAALDQLSKSMIQPCVLRGILTKQQVVLIRSGQDIYIHPDQFNRRVNR